MKNRFLFSAALPLVLAGCLQAQVNAPSIGVAKYLDNSVHAVFGVHDNFLVRSEAIGRADAISFSDFGGLLASHGHIQLVGPSFAVLAEYDSGEATPLLNIDGQLTTAIVWLPSQAALLYWNGTTFVVTDLRDQPPGHVTSVQLASPKAAKLLVTEPGGIVSETTISLETGNVISLRVLPGVEAPAFEQGTFLLFPTEHGLEVKSGNGVLRTLPISATDVAVERMSSDWLHLTSASTNQHWVLHLNERTLEISELPAIPASPATAGNGRQQ